MSGRAEPNKKKKIYHFHTEWEEAFFFTMSFSKCVCLICRSTVAISKKGNVERHFRTVHKNFDADFPPKSELRRRKMNELKSQLSRQHPFMSQLTSKAKAATEASFRDITADSDSTDIQETSSSEFMIPTKSNGCDGVTKRGTETNSSKCDQIVQTNIDKPQDCDEYYFMNLVKLFKKLSPQKKTEVRMKIERLLFEAEFE